MKANHFIVQLQERYLNIKISPGADKALEQRKTPLIVDMEIYFSGIICKKLRFNESKNHSDYTQVNDQIAVGFMPVITQRCDMHGVIESTPTVDFPITHTEKFIPHWLRIDYHKGQWRGEFGYIMEI